MPRKHTKLRELQRKPFYKDDEVVEGPNRVYLACDGDSYRDFQGSARGHADVGLSGQGLSKATDLSYTFDLLRLDAIYTSDLQRCQQTAQIIADKCDVPIIGRARELRTMNIGSMVGQVASRAGDTVCRMAQSRPTCPFPNGGESWVKFLSRTLPYIQSLMQRSTRGEYRRLLLITHPDCMFAAYEWGMRGLRLPPPQINPFEVYKRRPSLVVFTRSGADQDMWHPGIEEV